MIRASVIAPTPVMLAGLHSMLSSTEIEIVASTHENLLALVDVDVIVIADDQRVEPIVRTLADTQAMALVVLTSEEEKALTTLRKVTLRGWSILPLDAPASQLQAAVLAATQGLVTGTMHMLDQLARSTMPGAESLHLETIDESLTPREREVLELVSQGLSNKLIARSLHISEHTVKFHISSVSTKLGAASSTDAVRRGLRTGLITL